MRFTSSLLPRWTPLSLATLALILTTLALLWAGGSPASAQDDTQNTAPTITGEAAHSYAAHRRNAVGTYAANDPDGDDITWSLPAGADAGKFNIDSDGSLKFNAQPDFNSPGDADTNNKYQVTVRASDGKLHADLAVTVTVVRGNQPPVFSTAPTAVLFPENRFVPITYIASDPEGDEITWSVEGTDGDLFHFATEIPYGSLMVATLDFKQVAEFELSDDNPHWDADKDHVYNIIVKIADQYTSTQQAVAVTVTNVDEPPKLGGPAGVLREEGSDLWVATYAASDPEGDAIVWSLEGTDAGDFTIDGGTLNFRQGPDHSAPHDGDADNVYELTVKAADGTDQEALSTSKDVRVTVEAATGGIRITNRWFDHEYRENGTAAVATYSASDPQDRAITWSLEGTDSDQFTIGSASGELRFASSPDYESPADAGGDNTYGFTVKASAGSESATRVATVTVTDIDEPIVASGKTEISKPGGTAKWVETYTGIDPEGLQAYWDIAGTDANDFVIRNQRPNMSPSQAWISVVLRFKEVPDYDNPTDEDGDNVYELTVIARDHQSFVELDNFVPLDVRVTVTDPDELTVSGSSEETISENATDLSVATYTANNPGTETLEWSLEGTDAGDFEISSAGVLSFSATPDYESPNDDDEDNSYSVTVKATAGDDSVTKAVVVTVSNVDEGPTITGGPTSKNYAENGTAAVGTYTASDPESDTITWTVEGDDAASFNIGSSDGILAFVSSPDYETKTSYSVTVKATAGSKHATRAVAITITNVDEAPVITGGPTAPSYPENGTGPVGTYTATDPENDPISWTVEGTDAASFNIGGSSGELTFKTSPDYETKTSYSVTVKATAGSKHATRVVAVAITDVDDTSVPGRVTVIRATATSHTTVSLSWDAPSGGVDVTGYRVLRRAVASEDDFQALSQDTENTNTTWTDSGLSPHTKYAYRVRGLGANGAGPLSTLAEVRTPRIPLPGKVTVITATASGHDTVSLTWTAPSDGGTVTGYKIMRRAVDSQSSFEDVSPNPKNTNTSYTDSGLSARTKYAYRVSALNAHGEGKISALATVTTPAAPTPVPGQATGLTASATAHDTVSLSWTAPSDGGTVTGYRILRRDLGNEDSPQVLVQDTGGTGTSYVDSSATSRTRYAYRVLALGGSGAGEPSDFANVTTPRAPFPGKATGLTATASDGTVSLSWAAPTERGTVTGYQILRRELGSENELKVLVEDTGDTGTTYADSSVEAGAR